MSALKQATQVPVGNNVYYDPVCSTIKLSNALFI